jgi:hypothetical protein
MVFEAAHGQRPGEEGGYGGTWERVIEEKGGVESEAREKRKGKREGGMEGGWSVSGASLPGRHSSMSLPLA